MVLHQYMAPPAALQVAPRGKEGMAWEGGRDKSFDLASEMELVALVRLPTRFEYRNAAVRSVPPGSRFRVFQCEENHAGGQQ